MDDDLFESSLSKIAIDKRERIQRFHRWEDAHRTLLADLLIRNIVMKKFGIENEAITFSEDDNHKPYLNNVKNFHFNCAHSGQWVVCAVDEEPLGIDIEKIKPVDFDIAKRFFSKEEYGTLMRVEGSKRTDHFFRFWTLKESYLKAIGKGLRQSLGSFSIHYLKKNKIQLIINNEEVRNIFFKIYEIDPEYVLSVCASCPRFADSVVIKDVQEIIDSIVCQGN